MELIRTWILTVTVSALVIAGAEALMPQGSVKRVGKLTGGLILVLGILQPLVTMDYNPLSMINEDTNQNIYRRMQLTGKGELTILPDLTWTAQYSYLYNQNVLSEYHSIKSQIVKTHGQATRSTYMDKRQFCPGRNKLFLF